MFTKKLMSAAVMTGAVLMSGVASAGVVTLNPEGNGVQNGGPFIAPFDTTGGTLQLGTATAPSTLTIAGNSGIQSFSEAGTIYINSFTFGASNTPIGGVGQPGNYSVFGTYTLSGAGLWGGSVYTASTTGLIFNLNLFAQPPVGGPITLGTGSLIANPTNFAVALLGNGTAPGTNGTANTVLSAVLGFNPAPGTTGAGNFFEAPVPFDININVGSLGGNFGNTSYSISAGGVVTISTPTANQSPSTGNFTFTTNSTVPEPNALSLAGIALVGIAFLARRKTAKKA